MDVWSIRWLGPLKLIVTQELKPSESPYQMTQTLLSPLGVSDIASLLGLVGAVVPSGPLHFLIHSTSMVLGG